MTTLTLGKTIAILCAIAAVLLISLFIGIRERKNGGSAAQFIGASKSFGPIATGLASTAAMASGWLYVGTAGNIYANGNMMVTYIYLPFCFTLGYMFVGKKIRAMAEITEISTLGDIIDLRYGHSGSTRAMKAFYAVTIGIGCLSYLATQISAGCGLVTYLFPTWSKFLGCLALFGIVTVYILIGGEKGGVASQAFQGSVMTIGGLVFMFSFFRFGGFAAKSAALSAVTTVVDEATGYSKTFTPMMASAFGVDKTGVISMTWLMMPLLFTAAQPSCLNRMYVVKDPRDLPKAGVVSGISQMLVSFCAMSIGFAMLILVPTGVMGVGSGAEQITWKYAEFLGFGTQLLAYAAITAGIISSASMYMTTAANAFAIDFTSSLGFKFDDSRKITASRIAIAIVGLFGVLMATFSSETIAILGTLGYATIGCINFPLFVIGCSWKRATRKGMTAAALIAMIGNIFGFCTNFINISFPKGLPWYMWVIALTMIAAIIGSLLTQDEKETTLSPQMNAVFNL
ncbi:MAG: hypothetical protein IJI45_14625 [Anaerolineaceae bacterium]|nr:hypothetical protein [Anaerolineaceae bacterium]